MHHQPRGLVHHDQVLVLERDRERDVLRFVMRLGGQGHGHREHLARRRALRRIAHRQTVARHLPRIDQHLQPLARQRRRGVRQRPVEPPAIRCRCDPRFDDGNPPVHSLREMGMSVRIATELLARIVAEAAGSPDEICGLLFGTPATIEAAQPCRNVAADPATRFEIDPAQLLAAYRAARQGGPAIIGCYHSHPSGAAMPSARDAADAAGDGFLWLIVAGEDARLFRAVPDGEHHRRFDSLPTLPSSPRP